MKKWLIVVLVLMLPASLFAEILDAWNYGLVIKPADTVYITIDSLWGSSADTTTIPSGASPRGISFFNWTSAGTLLVNEEGNVPALSYPWSTNSFVLVGADSYVNIPSPPSTVVLWVPSDSVLVNIRWAYKP